MRPLLAALFLAWPISARAAFPLEETRVAAALQTRLQDSLDRVFGAGRSAAAVSATLAADSRVARRIDDALGGGKAAAGGRYEWTWAEAQEISSGRFILPGLSDSSPAPGVVGGLSVEAAANLSKRTARLLITVMLDETLPPEADGRALELAARSVNLDKSRGDMLEIARAPMPRPAPPPANPVSALFLWSCLLVFTAAAAGVFYFADRMLRRVKVLPRAEPPPLPAPEPPRQPPPPLPEDVLTRVRAPFQIPQSDAAKLFFLLRKESSEDIALVLPHLFPDTRKALLAYFSEEEAARAVEASARFRVVDPELIVLLKAELERRVAALHGGPEVAAGLLDDATPEDRARILTALERFEPELARSMHTAEEGA